MSTEIGKYLLAALDFSQVKIQTFFDSLTTRSRLQLRGATVECSFRTRGWLDLHIHRTSTVKIGAHCRLNSGFANNPVGGYRRLGIWVARDAQLQIGQNVGISNATIVCANAITIEDDVFIGGGTSLFDTDFHSIPPAARLAVIDTTVKTAPIIIKRRCSIGGHSIILKGVTIGEAAVIGAGSVVTRDVPDGEIWAGNPARRIGQVECI